MTYASGWCSRCNHHSIMTAGIHAKVNVRHDNDKSAAVETQLVTCKV